MFGRKRSRDGFAEEITAHLELEADELKREGLTDEDARRQARIEFGNVRVAQERFYLKNRVVWLDHLLCDVSFAIRQLIKNPGFAATAILVLALGIGANVAIFAFVDVALIKPLPCADPQRLVHVTEREMIEFGAPGTPRWEKNVETHEVEMHLDAREILLTMSTLGSVFEGWNGYETSVLHAIKPLTTEQLRWRPASGVRSLGEIIRHLSLGRVNWLARISAPGIEDVCRQVPRWYTDSDGARHVVEDSVQSDESAILTHWLESTWGPIQQILEGWTIEHLFQTYRHKFHGTEYIVSNQWTLWRIMSHDVHHGGQIAMMLACQDIPAFELRALGGHVVTPAVAPPQSRIRL